MVRPLAIKCSSPLDFTELLEAKSNTLPCTLTCGLSYNYRYRFVSFKSISYIIHRLKGACLAISNGLNSLKYHWKLHDLFYDCCLGNSIKLLSFTWVWIVVLNARSSFVPSVYQLLSIDISCSLRGLSSKLTVVISLAWGARVSELSLIRTDCCGWRRTLQAVGIYIRSKLSFLKSQYFFICFIII